MHPTSFHGVQLLLASWTQGRAVGLGHVHKGSQCHPCALPPPCPCYRSHAAPPGACYLVSFPEAPISPQGLGHSLWQLPLLGWGECLSASCSLPTPCSSWHLQALSIPSAVLHRQQAGDRTGN